MSAANTTGATIDVVLSGTNVPLPEQTYMNGVTASGDNETFTIADAGTYYVSYKIKTTASIAMSSAVSVNGIYLDVSVNAPAVGVSEFSADFIFNFIAGTQLQLVLYGFLGSAVLQSGAGASLNVIRIA